VTNTFLFARDASTGASTARASAGSCKPRESLTRDHVVPISRGGVLNVWTNVVTACSSRATRGRPTGSCTRCGLQLLHAPVEPHFVHLSLGGAPAHAHRSRTTSSFFYGSEVVHKLEAMERRNGGTLPPEARILTG
jgi:5-methylcytosine-specific restriction endonuclease McrA